MRELRALRLPQLVEARRKRASSSSELDLQDLPESGSSSTHGSPLHLSHSSTSSELPQSPTTPIFSLRSSTRLSSSASSLASSPVMRESLDGYMGKRPLTEVKEEPQQEKDDVDMSDASMCRSSERGSRHITDAALRDSLPGADYEWIDSPTVDEIDFECNAAKRRRAEPPSPSGMTARWGTRFPVLSRRWKSKVERRKSSLTESLQDSIMSRSRASSLRAPSVLEGRTEVPLPPTPSESFVLETPEQMLNSAGDISQDIAFPDDTSGAAADGEEVEAEGPFSRTPLLPPVMTSLKTIPDDEPIQSPLQSPKVIETPTSPHSPALSSPYFPTPAVTTTATTISLPSPPLSTRPSMSSVRHHPLVSSLPPASDIPPMLLSPTLVPQDEWALRLGHANFNIKPEPYDAPAQPTITDVQQLRQAWESARREYAKHLSRTGCVYSTTSRPYALTEEKWAAIDAAWKRAHDRALAAIAPHARPQIRSRAASAAAATAPTSPTNKPTNADDPVKKEGTTTDEAAILSTDEPSNAPIKMPPLNGPQSAGKFPAIGDRGIVGLMQRAPPPVAPPRPSRKRAFWKFLQGMFPSGSVVAAKS